MITSLVSTIAIIFYIVYLFISMEKSELKKRRERLGLTQTVLAETIGISANTVSRYETGTMTIPKNMELILEALEKRHIEDMQKTIREGE